MFRLENARICRFILGGYKVYPYKKSTVDEIMEYGFELRIHTLKNKVKNDFIGKIELEYDKKHTSLIVNLVEIPKPDFEVKTVGIYISTEPFIDMEFIKGRCFYKFHTEMVRFIIVAPDTIMKFGDNVYLSFKNDKFRTSLSCPKLGKINIRHKADDIFIYGRPKFFSHLYEVGENDLLDFYMNFEYKPVYSKSDIVLSLSNKYDRYDVKTLSIEESTIGEEVGKTLGILILDPSENLIIEGSIIESVITFDYNIMIVEENTIIEKFDQKDPTRFKLTKDGFLIQNESGLILMDRNGKAVQLEKSEENNLFII